MHETRVLSSTATFVALALAVAAGGSCCSKGDKGLEPKPPKARQIVSRNAEDAFDAFFSRDNPEDRTALTTFQQRIAAAATRADLEAAWQAIPELRAKGADFLQRRVFKAAAEDGDWPAGEIDERDAYAGGVRDGVSAFLATGGR